MDHCISNDLFSQGTETIDQLKTASPKQDLWKRDQFMIGLSYCKALNVRRQKNELGFFKYVDLWMNKKSAEHERQEIK